MPELPQLRGHAERLESAVRGLRLTSFRPLTITALKTVTPSPEDAIGAAVRAVTTRGKYLLIDVSPVTFAVHLMHGGRLEPAPARTSRPRNGVARFEFHDGTGLLLTEPGTERRAGVWCLPDGADDRVPPLDGLGPDADTLTATELLTLLGRRRRRLHGFLRDQHELAGLGRRLADEVCHRVRRSPFVTTDRLDVHDARRIVTAIGDLVAEGLAVERGRTTMSRAADRPAAVHGRAGEPCPVCGDAVRTVTYRDHTVHYCPRCQTDGRVLSDNTTSRFLK